MSDSQLVVASNRGPVSWRRAEGRLVPRRGFGGLVTALGGALQREPGTWVSVAMSAEDAEVAAEHRGEAFRVDTGSGQFTLRLLDVGRERFEAHYNRVANQLLWFTVHGLWGAPYEPAGVGWSADWDDGYLPVNEAVADAVVAAVRGAGGHGGAGEVHLQDYHLTVAPRLVREALPDVAMLAYLHTPWAPPSYLQRLPDRVVSELLRGLLAADVVGFSSPIWAEEFRRCATDLLGAGRDGDAIRLDGRRTLVRSFVLGVDADDLAASAADAATVAAGEDLDRERADRALILRVDRTDLSKNILRGLHAYELLLSEHPEHVGRVWHYAHLNPSRQGVPAYRDYLDACRHAVERIQERFGQDSVTVFVGDDYPKAVAALQRSDVLLCNPVTDGTNLVAKEGPVLNTRDGVMVLSRGAGAADVMAPDTMPNQATPGRAEPGGRAGALLVNPYDVEEQAAALHRALVMDAGERAARAEVMRAAARRGSPEEWLAAQRTALREALAARPGRST